MEIKTKFPCFQKAAEALAIGDAHLFTKMFNLPSYDAWAESITNISIVDTGNLIAGLWEVEVTIVLN